MNHLNIETEDNFSILLELAANNDVSGFKQLIKEDPSCIDRVGTWYGRQNGLKQMVLLQRTALMIASTYGSIDLMKLILSSSESDVNRSCGPDESTALHCAASGGSDHALEAVRLLLAAGADPNTVDVNGSRPLGVMVISPKLLKLKSSLEQLLGNSGSNSGSNDKITLGAPMPISSSPENVYSSTRNVNSERKEYPFDPSFPDIKDGIYSTDEFRMFSFKVRPCSRAYSHDWTECPFVHPGENARRRDPRKFHYSCVPCPDFRKGGCRRGDMCEYAHGVFESWLHPAQYRTRLCKDGVSCERRVCFFAHVPEEIRPLYPTASTGTSLSPRSAAALSLLPGLAASFTPPMSPNNNNGVEWTPHLQSSRLRSSINARDVFTEELILLSDFDLQQKQLYQKLSCLNQGSNSLGRSDLFLAENSIASPRFPDQGPGPHVYPPTTIKSHVLNHFQQQQSVLSPTYHFPPNFGSPRTIDSLSPVGSRVSMLSQREKLQQLRSLSSRELGSNSDALLGWVSSDGNPDWAVGANDLGSTQLRRTSSFEIGKNGNEPDFSWVQSLVKESPTDRDEKTEMPISAGTAGDRSNEQSENELMDPAKFNAWFEKMEFK